MNRVFDIVKRCDRPDELLYRQHTRRATQDYIGDFLEPWELCYKSKFDQQPQARGHYYMPDIAIDQFWWLRCRVQCTNGVITYIEGCVIPNEDRWPAPMVESLTALLKHRSSKYQVHHWGQVDISFSLETKELHLAYFYNYSTCYLSKSEMFQYYPERWHGVMRRAFCMCVQAYINVQQAHSRVKIGLWAAPLYRYNKDTHVVTNPPQSLGRFYHNTFGFGPSPNGQPEIPDSGAMATKVESILDKCQDVFKNLKRLAPRKLRRLKKLHFRWQPTRLTKKFVVSSI